MSLTKKCLFCGGEFEKKVNESIKDWLNRHKYCSPKCRDDARKGKSAWNSGLKIKDDKRIKPAWNKGLTKETDKRVKKYGQTQKGKKHSKETIEIIRQANTGNKSHKWKGNKAGERSKHLWVERQLGKAKDRICELCKEKPAKHWSNKDHKYRRNLKDWQAVCVKCHQDYDKKYNGMYKNRGK